jgi:exodeoxyribonuclease V alpha subunit
MQEQTYEFQGIIDKFLFQNTENGYCVFLLQIPERNETIVARGYIGSIQPGQDIHIKGIWAQHPKFGKQFEVQSCVAQAPTSITGLQKYLGSGLIKGIGHSYAEKLIAAFGKDVLEIIDKFPHKLKKVPGIGPKRIEMIVKGWQDQKEISNVMVYLQEKGISTSYAVKIYKMYQQNAIAILQENPYRLAEDIWGIGFKTADEIATNLGIAKDSPKRIKAGILHAINEHVGNGHLYMEVTALKKSVIEILILDSEAAEPLLKNALHDLYNDSKIKLITFNDLHYITLSFFYFNEKGVAQKIKNLLNQPVIHQLPIDPIYQKMREIKPGAIALNEEQQKGILTCLQQKITIITGGPGTGKTTLIRQLLEILDEYNLSYKLAAPTGRAAKRITQGTGRIALTLHRLLEFDFTNRSFTRNEQNALKLDFLIIDEASMIDIFLAHAILKATPLNAHLIFIGDIDQLPSVAAGNFLNDLIASNKVTCIRLKHIFRQAQDSLIITNAHRINNGEFPTSNLENCTKDFIFIKEEDPANVQAHLQELLLKKIPQRGILTEDAIVLTPMNRGIVGTQQLNNSLQQLLNSQSVKTITHGFYTFKVHDRVMQIRNNYDKAVFNGDIGTIDDINISDKIVMVRYFERIIEYEFTELDELVLAYAISIHKSQGSEYPAVIITLFTQHFTLLQRNLIYTAVTRAKKLCILIGQVKAIAIAIKNNKGLDRTTFLTQFLISDLQAR